MTARKRVADNRNRLATQKRVWYRVSSRHALVPTYVLSFLSLIIHASLLKPFKISY